MKILYLTALMLVVAVQATLEDTNTKKYCPDGKPGLHADNKDFQKYHVCEYKQKGTNKNTVVYKYTRRCTGKTVFDGQSKCCVLAGGSDIIESPSSSESLDSTESSNSKVINVLQCLICLLNGKSVSVCKNAAQARPQEALPVIAASARQLTRANLLDCRLPS